VYDAHQNCTEEAGCPSEPHGYCANLPSPSRDDDNPADDVARGPLTCEGTQMLTMPAIVGGSVQVCVISKDKIFCGNDGRCFAHPCYTTDDCRDHEACVGAETYLRVDERFYVLGSVPPVEVRKRDVRSGRCQCVSNAACQFDGDENPMSPLCREGACVCAVTADKDSCDPHKVGQQRCDDDSGACVCAADSFCKTKDERHPVCSDAGACVCSAQSCGAGFLCLDGRCLCDSDEACVETTGGYHSVCIDHVCGCTDVAGCRSEGPPLIEDGPPQAFAAHSATDLVCEPIPVGP
jgi:hypothetical protein